MRVVLDTNTIVSGIGWEGPPRRVLLALRRGKHHLIISPDLLAELTAVLRYPKLRLVAGHPQLKEVLAWLHRPEHLIYSVERINAVADDPRDNLVLEAAVAGRADVIVSGDKHLLNLRKFRETPIMTARKFASRHLQGSQEG